MNFRQAPSRWKNQILTAQKRDQYHSELDLTRNTIGNDGARTVQANHDTIIFSCGSSGVGFVPLNSPGKFGFQHKKINCGSVSDIHISPFLEERIFAVSCSDQSVKVYAIPDLESESDEASALHSFRASAGTANTSVLVCWNPQVSGILAVASGNKLDIFSRASDKIVTTIEIDSPAISMDWAHDGEKIYVISKDSTLRIVDPRASTSEKVKITGTKHVVRCLPNEQFVISSLSRMRERELNLYHNDASDKSLKSWNFGTASTPLIPIADTARKIVYLLDKSGGVLRWLETFAPYNEGAAGTTIDQSSSGCLIHPFGLQLMEGEINRVIIGDTKGNTVPIKISIGRKSYVEFHDDLYTPAILESAISADDWLQGKSGLAKLCNVTPSLAAKVSKGESISSSAFSASTEKKDRASKTSLQENTNAKVSDLDPTPTLEDSTSPNADNISSSEPITPKQSVQHTQSMPNLGSTLSAREQRKWDREERKNGALNSSEIHREDQSARRAEYGAGASKEQEARSTPDINESSQTKPSKEDEGAQVRGARASPNKELEMDMAEEDVTASKRIAPALDDEDALEAMRARRVTPAVEQSQLSNPVEIQSPQPQREVFREDLSARRAEYGAQPTGAREVFRENLGERRAEYGAMSSPNRLARESPRQTPVQSEGEAKQSNGETKSSDREVYKEDLSARRAEYGAPSSKSSQSPAKISSPALSAREQRKWDKEERTKVSSPKVESGSKDLTSQGQATDSDQSIEKQSSAEDVMAKPSRTSTAEREVYREDLTARRAEYGATPKLDGPTQAYKEITRALGQTTISPAQVSKPETEPYGQESNPKIEVKSKDSEQLALENVYAPPTEKAAESATKANTSKPDDDTSKNVDAPEAASVKRDSDVKPTTTNSSESLKIDRSSFSKADGSQHREYTRKYLEGKPQHVSNSYTSLIGLNASLPNTARMIDATSSHIIIPLAGPGGRLAIIPYSRSGRLPPLLTGFMGGTQVVDFELDRFKKGRLVSAHADQTVKVWAVPENLDDLETDVQDTEKILSGMDRILSLSFNPIVSGLLMVTTSTKIHLFDVATGKELSVYLARGVANTCWSLDGNKIALGKSDKTIVILDARTGEEIKTFPSAHQSSRPFRVQFVAEDRLITAGFGSGSTRQLALYDIEKGQKLQVHDMDISPSPFSLPYYDEMSSILYLIPRGTSAILPFHMQEDSFTPLTSYTAADPIMGTSFLPPQELDTQKVEIARCLRLTTNEVSVVGFHIPRPTGDLFHDDIYPAEIRDRYTPSLTIQEWQSGTNAGSHKTIDLNPKGLKGSSAAGVGSFGKKSGVSIATKATFKAREPEAKKPSELEQMFQKAKVQDGDEPEYQNNAENTRWD